MIIRFDNEYINYNNWRKVINNQRDEHRSLNTESWFKWFEKEWQCKITIYENMMESMEFDDKSYCIAVLRFGPPD